MATLSRWRKVVGDMQGKRCRYGLDGRKAEDQVAMYEAMGAGRGWCLDIVDRDNQ